MRPSTPPQFWCLLRASDLFTCVQLHSVWFPLARSAATVTASSVGNLPPLPSTVNMRGCIRVAAIHDPSHPAHPRPQLPSLSRMFQAESGDVAMFSTHWFNTIFAYCLPFSHLLRVWDIFMFEGPKVCVGEGGEGNGETGVHEGVVHCVCVCWEMMFGRSKCR